MGVSGYTLDDEKAVVVTTATTQKKTFSSLRRPTWSSSSSTRKSLPFSLFTVLWMWFDVVRLDWIELDSVFFPCASCGVWWLWLCCVSVPTVSTAKADPKRAKRKNQTRKPDGMTGGSCAYHSVDCKTVPFAHRLNRRFRFGGGRCALFPNGSQNAVEVEKQRSLDGNPRWRTQNRCGPP